METFPKVAIIVLNYNGEKCLIPCLQSLSSLLYKKYSVLVVDNHSEDNSFALAQEQFPQFSYLQRSENGGFAAGMNTGIQWAEENQFDFVWLMNYDAKVSPESLTLLIEAHQANPQIQAMSPVIVKDDGEYWFTGGRINYWRMRTEHDHVLHSTKPYKTDFLTGCAPLFSLKLLQRVGFFDERFFLYYEDADLSCRIKKKREELWVIPQAVIYHEERSNLSRAKIYHLVFSGLLFFVLHTPKYARFYVLLYVTIRRIVNRIKLFFGLPDAALVATAYADYFKKFQAGYKLHLRQLP